MDATLTIETTPMRTSLTHWIFPFCLVLTACTAERRDLLTPATPADPTAQVSGAGHAHHHAAPASTLERPAGGLRWATDEPLRQGMERVHRPLTTALPAFERGQFNASGATALAGAVRREVEFLVENCKLEPAADAQLHRVIAQMLAAASAMSQNPSASDGVPQLQSAVELYGEYFDDPGLHRAIDGNAPDR